MTFFKNYILNNKIIYLGLFFIISRIFYYEFFNIKFDSWTIDIYWQFYPLDLLKNDLIQSTLYNHYQPPFLNLLVGSLMKITIHYLFFIQLIFLIFGFLSFLLIYHISKDFKLSDKTSFLITTILMLLPTTILYENHLYKEYITFFLLLWLFYSTMKILNDFNSLKYVLYISLSLSLLCLTRETFHILWGYILIFIIQKNMNFTKKILLFSIFSILVIPFYLKNLILFDKFSLSNSIYEHLNQKIDFVKEMDDPERHEKIRDLTFGSYENYKKFKLKTSPLYEIPINSSAYTYKDFLNYDYKYDNQLLQTNTMYNEIWFEVDKHRKNDFFLVLGEQPLLIILNIFNSITRHLFTSSDYFNFTKHNADKMKFMIKISDCIKLTPVCIYDHGFDWKTSYVGNISYMGMDTGPLNYKEKIIFSLQYTNFLLAIVYISLLFFLLFSLFSKKNEQDKMINFWLITFIFIFVSLVVFEDGEIARHRFPFDYLCFLIFLKKLRIKVYLIFSKKN